MCGMSLDVHVIHCMLYLMLLLNTFLIRSLFHLAQYALTDWQQLCEVSGRTLSQSEQEVPGKFAHKKTRPVPLS